MPLTAGAQGQEKEKEGGEGGFEWNLVYLVAVPATCDFIATYLLNIGLL